MPGGPRVLIAIGMMLTGVGLVTLASISASSGYWSMGAALFAIGIGLGLIAGPIATVAVANAPAARSGMSSGLVNVGRMVGATIGVAVLVLMFGPRIEEAAKDAAQFLAGMSMSFLIGGGAVLGRNDCGHLAAPRFAPDEGSSRLRDQPP